MTDPVAPGAKLALVQVAWGLVAAVVQVKPAPLGLPTKDVPVGRASVTDTLGASDGPALVTEMVQVTVVASVTVVGAQVLVIPKLATGAAVVTLAAVVAELLVDTGSGVLDEALAVLAMTVPPAVLGLTLTTTVKLATERC